MEIFLFFKRQHSINNTNKKRRRQNPNMTLPVPNLVLDPLPVLFLPLSLRPLLILWSSKVHPPLHRLLSFSSLRVQSAVPGRGRHVRRGTSSGGGGGHPCRVGLSLRRPEKQAGSGNGGGDGGSSNGGQQPLLQICLYIIPASSERGKATVKNLLPLLLALYLVYVGATLFSLVCESRILHSAFDCIKTDARAGSAARYRHAVLKHD